MDPQFRGLTSASVLTTTVGDAPVYGSTNRGTAVSSSGLGATMLIQFDLSSLPGFAGGTINDAQLRLLGTGGNQKVYVRQVTSHPWTETGVTQSLTGTGTGWGASGTSSFSFSNDTYDNGAYRWYNIGSPNTNGKYMETAVIRVTDYVQAWADGTPNYGFGLDLTNGNAYTSEAGATYQPVLFIDYTPAVPEPATLALVALGGVALLKRRHA